METSKKIEILLRKIILIVIKKQDSRKTLFYFIVIFSGILILYVDKINFCRLTAL